MFPKAIKAERETEGRGDSKLTVSPGANHLTFVIPSNPKLEKMREHDLLDATVTVPTYERQSKPIGPTETTR